MKGVLSAKDGFPKDAGRITEGQSRWVGQRGTRCA